eukprot:11206868-Lingulodinium_polyedra.AAC.1
MASTRVPHGAKGLPAAVLPPRGTSSRALRAKPVRRRRAPAGTTLGVTGVRTTRERERSQTCRRWTRRGRTTGPESQHMLHNT